MRAFFAKSKRTVALFALSLGLLIPLTQSWDGPWILKAKAPAPLLPLPTASFAPPAFVALARSQNPLKKDFFAQLRDLDRGDEKARTQARQSLVRLAGKLGPEMMVATHVTLARSQAGLNFEGQKVRATASDYRTHLARASRFSGDLSETGQKWALAVMLAIWQRAEGRQIDWSKSPFSLQPFASRPEIKAVIERVALQDLTKGQVGPALRKYQALASDMAGTPARVAFDARILDLAQAEGRRTKNPQFYERSLIAQRQLYLDPGVLGEGHEGQVKKVSEMIDARYHAFVMDLLNEAAKGGASKVERLAKLRTATRYLEGLPEGSAIASVKGRMADVFALMGMHAPAAKIYTELAGSGRSTEERRFLALAIKSQSVLASWPLEVNWGPKARGDAAARETLLSLYASYNRGGAAGSKETGSKAGEGASATEAPSASSSDNATDFDPKAWRGDWPTLAQAGLLMLDLGRSEEAFRLWTHGLNVAPQGRYASEASGFMITAYERGQRYGDLEQLSRLALAKGLRPRFRGTLLDVRQSLALALREEGRQALANQDFATATRKLEEAYKKHGDDKKHDQTTFLVAYAYRGVGRHQDAIAARTDFVERYPQSPLLREALLTAGDWSTAMAHEEAALAFKERFLKHFTRDPEAGRLRQQLLALYMGRELYAEALKLLNNVAQSAPAGSPESIEASHQTLGIEMQHGSPTRAALLASRLIATPGAPAEVLADAYRAQLHGAIKANNWAAVGRIEATLAGRADEAPLREPLGEARLAMAHQGAQNVIKDVFNLELKDPYATLKERYEGYLSARKGYERVCEGEGNSFCIPAMAALSQLSLTFASSIEDIAIQESLAEGPVKRFRAFKAQVERDVALASQRAEAKAQGQVALGQGTPDWAKAVKWQDEARETSDAHELGTDRGFVQWSEGVDP